MQTAFLCLLSTALSAPVLLSLPGRAAGNCVGQHQILLKGCNAKHGFYIFKHIYSFSTQRNQTQIEKEEANSQSASSSHHPGKDDTRQGLTQGGASPERGDYGGTEVVQKGTSLKTENRSTPDVDGDARDPHLGTSTRPHSNVVTVTGPTPASSEGSGDLDLVVEIDGDVSVLPQGRQPSEAVAGNRSGIRSRDEDDGAPVGVLVERAMTAGGERAPTTGGAGDEGSGKATVDDQRQEGAKQGRGMGGTSLTSVTEKMEDVQVNAKGVDEYAYIPDSGSVTITQEKVGSTEGSTSFTKITPDVDNKVSLFIGKANIRVGEKETNLAAVTVGSEDDSIPTAETSSPMPRLGITVAHDSDDDGDNAVREQPKGPATPSLGDSTTSSSGFSHPTGDNKDGAITASNEEGPVTSSPWRVIGGDVTVPTVAGGREDDDKLMNRERQNFTKKMGPSAVSTLPQGTDEEAATSAPAGRASIRLGTTVASPRVREGNCTTTLRTASSPELRENTVVGKSGSGEAGPATLQPRREGHPGAGSRVQPTEARLGNRPSVDQVPSSHGKDGSQALSRVQVRVSGHSGSAGGRLHGTEAEGSPRLQAGRARGRVRTGEGRQQGKSGEAGVVAAGSSHLPWHGSRRLEAAVPGAFVALGHSRQVEQVKRTDKLHVQEQSFYTLSGGEDAPHHPYASLGSADSSQSSEGSRSDN